MGRGGLYLNAFSPYLHELPWREEPIFLCGGGNRVWAAVYDLNSQTFVEDHYNGILRYEDSCAPATFYEDGPVKPSSSS
jgi:hypothetical protein